MEHISWAGQKSEKSSTALKGNIEIGPSFKLKCKLVSVGKKKGFKSTYKTELWPDQTAFKACFLIDFRARLALHSGPALPQKILPIDVEVGGHIKVVSWVGIVGLECYQAETTTQNERDHWKAED